MQNRFDVAIGGVGGEIAAIFAEVESGDQGRSDNVSIALVAFGHRVAGCGDESPPVVAVVVMLVFAVLEICAQALEIVHQ